jgi:cystathionine beta-lyase/cystathionine gamma-synthase
MTDDMPGMPRDGADGGHHPNGEPEKKYSSRSRFVHGKAHSPHWDYSHHVVPPISASATYRLDSVSRGALGFVQFGAEEIPERDIFIYDRLHEPTSAMLEDRLAEAEGGDIGVSFSTGMAAISASIMAIAKAGDHVIAHQLLYGCTSSLLHNWLPRLGVEVSHIDLGDAEQLRATIRPNTRVIYGETPVNPTLDIIDLKQMADIANEANEGRDKDSRIYTVVDNTFATPICQRPIEHGIDIVVHSLTKGIGGFGTDMGGMVIAPRVLRPSLLLYRKDFGGSLSPKAAWPPLVYGLPTLPVRMRQQIRSAEAAAKFLEQHPLVARVRYPGLESDPHHKIAKRQMRGFSGKFRPGSMVYFTLKENPGSNMRAEKFIDYAAEQSYIMTLAVSLGQVKTLIENPRSMTHSTIDPEEQVSIGIEPGGIRLSCGIEATQDIIADLEQCLEFVASHT